MLAIKQAATVISKLEKQTATIVIESEKLECNIWLRPYTQTR
jgi:hypothetical protein